MRSASLLAAAACGLAGFALVVAAAPLPPIKPVDLQGTVLTAEWVAERHIKGTPGMSGSAGRDRADPAHFIVALGGIEGVEPATARQMSFFVGGPKGVAALPPDSAILLKLNCADPAMLRAGMRLKIRGYTVRGDEGGTWTSYQALEILPDDTAAPPASPAATGAPPAQAAPEQ